MVLLADLLANNPVQPVSPENSTLCRSQRSIDHHPIHVSMIGSLVLWVGWLGMCCDVPYMSPNLQTVPPQSFPLIQEFQNFQCCIGLGFGLSLFLWLNHWNLHRDSVWPVCFLGS